MHNWLELLPEYGPYPFDCITPKSPACDDDPGFQRDKLHEDLRKAERGDMWEGNKYEGGGGVDGGVCKEVRWGRGGFGYMNRFRIALFIGLSYLLHSRV